MNKEQRTVKNEIGDCGGVSRDTGRHDSRRQLVGGTNPGITDQSRNGDGIKGFGDAVGVVSMELVWIPPGTFTMGSPANENGRPRKDGQPEEDGQIREEDPQHQVTISRGFWMGKYPVTQAQYQPLMGENPSFFRDVGADEPVDSVTRYKAKEFCGKLQDLLAGDPRGLTVRLPTEAEWEYACRAGTTTALYNGKELTTTRGRCRNLDEIAWYDGNSRISTKPVGQKQPNAWGLYDMLGNVMEWCEHGRRNYTSSAQTDPVGPGSSSVLRGGSWDSDARSCRSATRIYSYSGYVYDDSGFRVVVVR